MDSSERGDASARLDALKRSLVDEQQRDMVEHARVNKALLLNTQPRALSMMGAAAMTLIGAILFALIALAEKNAWFLLPSGALALFTAGAFIAAIGHSRE